MCGVTRSPNRWCVAPVRFALISRRGLGEGLGRSMLALHEFAGCNRIIPTRNLVTTRKRSVIPTNKRFMAVFRATEGVARQNLKDPVCLLFACGAGIGAGDARLVLSRAAVAIALRAGASDESFRRDHRRISQSRRPPKTQRQQEKVNALAPCILPPASCTL